MSQTNSKNDNLMYKTNQKRVLNFRKILSKEDLRISFYRTLSFFKGKSTSKKGGESYQMFFFWSAKARDGPTQAVDLVVTLSLDS